MSFWSGVGGKGGEWVLRWCVRYVLLFQVEGCVDWCIPMCLRLDVWASALRLLRLLCHLARQDISEFVEFGENDT